MPREVDAQGGSRCDIHLRGAEAEFDEFVAHARSVEVRLNEQHATVGFEQALKRLRELPDEGFAILAGRGDQWPAGEVVDPAERRDLAAKKLGARDDPTALPHEKIYRGITRGLADACPFTELGYVRIWNAIDKTVPLRGFILRDICRDRDVCVHMFRPRGLAARRTALSCLRRPGSSELSS
jgi:hypothetical protein